MARTVVATGDAIVPKVTSASFTVDVYNKSWWMRKHRGNAKPDGPVPKKPLIVYTDLERDAGDVIYYDLIAKLTGVGVESDNTLEGNEEKLIIYSASMKIDQMRHGVDAGGKMSRKRTKHNLVERGTDALSDWYAAYMDQAIFTYACGDRGDGTTNWLLPTTWTGRASNSLATPDASHNIWGGDATSDATLDTSDIMTLTVIDRAAEMAEMSSPLLQPISVDGDDSYTVVMHTYQGKSLRTNTAVGQWQDIQKSAASRGSSNLIFKGKDYLGEYNGVHLFKHPMVPIYTVAGSSWGAAGARALFLGRQALAFAWGSAGGEDRWQFHREKDDRGNVEIVDVGAIWGCIKNRFNSADLGIIAIDTAAASG